MSVPKATAVEELVGCVGALQVSWSAVSVPKATAVEELVGCVGA